MMKNKFLLLISIFLIGEISLPCESLAQSNQTSHQDFKRKPSMREMAIGATKATIAIKQNPFSTEAIWDQNYLKEDTEVAELIKKFMEGKYAQKAKELNFRDARKEEIVKKLLENNFKRREPNGRVDELLGKGKDREFQDAGEIYVHEDGSMVRVKDSSAKRHYRPQAYVVKAALKNKAGPVTWQNEAFKVSKDGGPIPKGPKQSQGLSIHAPSSLGPDEDKGWIDLIMEEAHTDIKS